jgi:hypothetical protein
MADAGSVDHVVANFHDQPGMTGTDRIEGDAKGAHRRVLRAEFCTHIFGNGLRVRTRFIVSHGIRCY